MTAFLPEIAIVVLTVASLAMRRRPALRIAALATISGYAYLVLFFGVAAPGRVIPSAPVDSTGDFTEGWTAATRAAQSYIEGRSVALLVALSCLLLLCLVRPHPSENRSDRG